MALAQLDLVDINLLRKKVQEAARKHKASWIELGQFLHTVYKNKFHKSWGYLTFEGYCKSELGLKETTASKLIKSYYFLENDEPRLAKEPLAETHHPNTIPNYEAVNLLRLAKQNKNLTENDFSELRKAVLTDTKEPKEVRAQIRQMLASRVEEEKDSSEVRRDRRNASLKRTITFLSNMKKEFESGNLLPAYLLKQIADLTAKLQDQLE